MLSFEGVHQQIMDDSTAEIALVGGRGSGKSTVGITKEIRYSVKYPGIKEFLFRFSDKDTESKLIPFYREMCYHEGESPAWNDKESCFVFKNGSITFMFGLRATNAAQRYSKLRGLGVARLLSDQTEEISGDIGLELRASLRQQGFPHQLTYIANPPSDLHWLAKQFPVGVEHRMKGRRLYQLSIYDNKHLPPETLTELEQAYPPEHPNYKTLMLGQYGISVTGEPIYGETFRRNLHVRPLKFDPEGMLFEAFDFGQLHPCWIVGQRPYAGGWQWLGGIMGQEMYMIDFLPIVKKYRKEWFGNLHPSKVRTCCTLSVNQDGGNLLMGVQELRNAGFSPTWKQGSNSPDVVLAVIERQAGYMRQRGVDGQEMFGINDAEERWLKANREGVSYVPFMTYAYQGGYAWREGADGKPQTVSVGRNEVRQPTSDQWYEFPMRCAEAIELNYGLDESQATKDKRRADQQKRDENSNSGRWESPQSWLGHVIFLVVSLGVGWWA